MSLDLSDKAIASACENVRSGKYQWALFGHKGNTPTVKVETTGDGFEDFVNELSSGKLQYAYLQFVINDAKKYVYVSWCPVCFFPLSKQLRKFIGWC